MAYDFYVRTLQDLIDAVQEFGIVPYFATMIPGFSLEDHCSPQTLFNDTEDNTWFWKGPVIRATGCAYGKFFGKKAAYVRKDLFLDLANYRRDGYDFDARYEEGLAKHQDKQLFDLIDENAPVTSKALRKIGGYAYHGRWQKTEGVKGFDTSVTRLQEQCYVITSGFVFTRDKSGRLRGWGAAEYSTPERFFGNDFSDHVYKRTPEESYQRLMAHMRTLLPDVQEERLKKSFSAQILWTFPQSASDKACAFASSAGIPMARMPTIRNPVGTSRISRTFSSASFPEASVRKWICTQQLPTPFSSAMSIIKDMAMEQSSTQVSAFSLSANTAIAALHCASIPPPAFFAAESFRRVSLSWTT